MITRNMEIKDCASVVRIHLRSFQGFFLSFLGPAFLSLLYLETITDPNGIALVSEQDKKIAGFVTGTTQPSGFYKRLMKRHLFGFFWASLKGFLRKPAILPLLLRAFGMPAQPLPADNCATLMSIAVDPSMQGQGLGKSLVNAFVEEARSRGSEYINLTTDAAGNDATNLFYQSLGFELFRQYSTPEKRLMTEYLIKLI